MTTDAHTDWELIQDLGGPAKVAQVLGYTKEGGTQRVQNWKFRGIPAHVKVSRPDLFMRSAAGARDLSASPDQPAPPPVAPPFPASAAPVAAVGG